MAKCSRCRSRKAKRRCPALRSDLCPLCCGVLRDKEIRCPADCVFRARHKLYQDKRTIEKKAAPPAKTATAQDDILKDERMAWLALHIEAPLLQAGESSPSFTDADAIMALEYAKEKLERNRRLVLTVGEIQKSVNEVGEAVWTSMEDCRFEQAVILASQTAGYQTEEKTNCLDRLIAAAKSWARANESGRGYLEHLAGQFAKIRQESRKTKILTAR